MVSKEIYEAIIDVKNAIIEGEFDEVIYERRCSIVEALRNLLCVKNVKTRDIIAALTVFTCGDFMLNFSNVDRFDLPTTELCCNTYKYVKKEYYKGYIELLMFNHDWESEQFGRYHTIRIYKDGKISELKTGKHREYNDEYGMCFTDIRTCKNRKNRSYLHKVQKLDLC